MRAPRENNFTFDLLMAGGLFAVLIAGAIGVDYFLSWLLNAIGM